MFRRLAQYATLLCALALACVLLCIGRARFMQDRFYLATWSPSTRCFSETRLHLTTAGIVAHHEATTALPTDNFAILQARLGGSNAALIHDVETPSRSSQSPALWYDHYRCTPSVGINTNGLSDCWTLEFRYEAAIVPLAVLPGFWLVSRIVRMARRNQMAARGFSVVVASNVNAPPSASPAIDATRV